MRVCVRKSSSRGRVGFSLRNNSSRTRRLVATTRRGKRAAALNDSSAFSIFLPLQDESRQTVLNQKPRGQFQFGDGESDGWTLVSRHPIWRSTPPNFADQRTSDAAAQHRHFLEFICCINTANKIKKEEGGVVRAVCTRSAAENRRMKLCCSADRPPP